MILAINTGSSSLKFKLFGAGLREISSGCFDGLKSARDYKNSVTELSAGIKKFANSERPLQAICHRVAHGGNLKSPYPISDKQSIRKIEKFNNLAPLHNPPAISVIKLFRKYFPRIKNSVVFDTSYFVDLPELSRLMPINRHISANLGYRKFGFHGISHQYVANQIDRSNHLKIISVHLGAGCSIAAIKNGLPQETSMSYTPMDGLIMQTRSGAIDPGIVLDLAKRYGLAKTEEILQLRSGLAGISGTDGDMKSLLRLAGYKVEDEKFDSAPPPDPSGDRKEMAKLAIDKYVYEIKKQIGAYNLILNGADVLAFTGKIGYNSSVIRDLITKDVDSFRGLRIQAVAPNEELAMAQELEQEEIQ